MLMILSLKFEWFETHLDRIAVQIWTLSYKKRHQTLLVNNRPFNFKLHFYVSCHRIFFLENVILSQL